MTTRTLSFASLGLVAALALAACGPSEKPKAPEAPTAAPPAAPPVSATPDLPMVDDDPTAADVDAAVVEARYTPHYKHCLDTGDAAKGVTTAMAECIGAELKLQDGALNAEYQRVMHAMPAAEFEPVRQAQRRWIQDRDAKCRAAASSGGAIDRLTGPQCVLDETIKRTLALEEIAAEDGR